MARRAGTALTRIEVLLLSSVARIPMSGYDMKLELRYKHVRLWAKVEHGHLYAALQRLEKRGDIRAAAASSGARGRRAFKITPTGSRRLHEALLAFGSAPDETHFDVDLFLQGTFLLDRDAVLAVLAARRASLAAQQADAEELVRRMATFVPLAGRLIMDHRIAFLRHELEFVDRAEGAIRAADVWGSFLGAEPIQKFVSRTGVALEADPAAPGGRKPTGTSRPRATRRRAR